MAHSSALKKARLFAGMTQTAVAAAAGVSQPTYQRWEAGTVTVPDRKLDKLAKALHVSRDVLLGRPLPFDLLGIDKAVSDDRTYYGEVAVHFAGDGASLLLPISEAERSALCFGLAQEGDFVRVESLDNRTVFLRRSAIADVFFSSDAYDDFGPDGYGTQHLGVHPHDSFWKIVEYLDCTELLDDEFTDEEINEALSKARLTEEELDELVANGSVPVEERERVKEEARETTNQFTDRACLTSWQLSTGRIRSVSLSESKAVYELCNALSISEEGELLRLEPEGYHRFIFLNPCAVDYIAMPSHKVREGEVACAAEDLGEAIER